MVRAAKGERVELLSGAAGLAGPVLGLDGSHTGDSFARPLSGSAVARMIRDGLNSEPDPVFVAACAQASGGNPFVLRVLLVDLVMDGVAPVATQAAGVAQRIPGQVQRAVLARLVRLDESTVRLARAMAVLGERTDLLSTAAEN